MSTSPYYNKIQVDVKVDDLEQQIANVADGTAGKAYPDLITAMSVTPLPDNGVIFTIDEYNETEAGVYAYDSGESEGYRFVRSIYKNQKYFIKDNDPILKDSRFNGLIDLELYTEDPGYELQIDTWAFNRPLSGIYRHYFSLKRIDGTAIDYVLTPNTTIKYIDTPNQLSGYKDFLLYQRQTSNVVGKLTVNIDEVFSGSPITMSNNTGVFTNLIFKGLNFFPNLSLFQDGDILSNSQVGKAFLDIKIKSDPLREFYISRYGLNVPNSGVYRHTVHIYDKDSNINTFNNPVFTLNPLGGIVFETEDLISGKFTLKLYELGREVGYIILDTELLNQGSYVNISSNSLGKNGVLNYNKTIFNFGNEFIEDEQRLILGNELYLTNQLPIQLFKENILINKELDSRIFIQNSEDEKIIHTSMINNILEINSNLFTNESEVRVYNHIYGIDKIYDKKIKIYNKNVEDIVDSCDIIMFGDSITDGVSSSQGVTQYVKEYLDDFNVISNFYGLRSTGGVNHEGRSSWEWAILIGLRTQYSTTIYVPTDSNTNSLSSQPFIKIATPQQLIDNPEWCFENTPSTNSGVSGKIRELNYIESQIIGTYTGDYYTFDFEKYININLSSPLNPNNTLIVTNALGFNDLNHNGKTEQSKLDCLLGMRIFFSRVKEYRPDAVVGFVPIVSVHPTNDWKSFSNYIERAIILSKELGADVIPVWQSVDMIGGYSYNGTEEEFSNQNDTLISFGGDKVHPTKYGAKQYASIVSNFIANKL